MHEGPNSRGGPSTASVSRRPRRRRAEPGSGECRRTKSTPHEARASFIPDPREPPGTDPYAGSCGGRGEQPPRLPNWAFLVVVELQPKTGSLHKLSKRLPN